VNDLSGLSIEERGGAVLACLTGELDLAEAGSKGERIVQAVPASVPTVVIDLTQLRFIDSSGVAMLFSLARYFDVRRQELRVVASPDGLVARVLELVQFKHAAPIHADVDEALARPPRAS
jgi:anti-anti-sigma factor